MQKVSTSDQRWEVSVEWSPYGTPFTVVLRRWERQADATGWALEDVRVLPMVDHDDLQSALDETMHRLAQEMQERTGANLRPF